MALCWGSAIPKVRWRPVIRITGSGSRLVGVVSGSVGMHGRSVAALICYLWSIAVVLRVIPVRVIGVVVGVVADELPLLRIVPLGAPVHVRGASVVVYVDVIVFSIYVP